MVPGGKTVFVAFGVLLQVCGFWPKFFHNSDFAQATKGVSEWFDNLNDFFKDLQAFLKPVAMVLPFHEEMGAAFRDTVLAMFVHTIEVAYGAMKTIGQSSAKGRISVWFASAW